MITNNQSTSKVKTTGFVKASAITANTTKSSILTSNEVARSATIDIENLEYDNHVFIYFGEDTTNKTRIEPRSGKSLSSIDNDLSSIGDIYAETGSGTASIYITATKK